MRKYAWIYVILSIIVAVWVGRYFTKQRVNTEIADIGLFEEKQTVSGMFVRNETVYASKSSGTFEAKVKEGDRVPAWKTVATVYKGEIDSQLKQQLDVVEQKIERLEERSAAQKDIFSKDVSTIESQVKSSVSDIINASRTGKISEIDIIKSELANLSEKDAKVSGRDNAGSASLNKLYAEKKNIESKINASQSGISATSTGIFSTQIDGLEDVLNMKSIETMSVDDFSRLEVNNKNTNGTVSTGDRVCKTIDNSEYAIAFLLDASKAIDLKLNQSVKLRFNDLSDETVSGNIKSVSAPSNGKALVCVGVTHTIKGVYGERKVQLDFISRSYEGIKIHVSALHVDSEGNSGVYVNASGIAKFRKCDVIYTNNDIAIVKNEEGQGKLKLYDSVIVNGKDIEDGKIID